MNHQKIQAEFTVWSAEQSETKYLSRTPKTNAQSSQRLVTAELCIALSKLCFKHRFNDQGCIEKI